MYQLYYLPCSFYLFTQMSHKQKKTAKTHLSASQPNFKPSWAVSGDMDEVLELQRFLYSPGLPPLPQRDPSKGTKKKSNNNNETTNNNTNNTSNNTTNPANNNLINQPCGSGLQNILCHLQTMTAITTLRTLPTTWTLTHCLLTHQGVPPVCTAAPSLAS